MKKKWSNKDVYDRFGIHHLVDRDNYVRCSIPDCVIMCDRMTCHTRPIDDILAPVCDFHFEELLQRKEK